MSIYIYIYIYVYIYIYIYIYLFIYIGNKETINWILIVRMKNEREINKKEMFFSTLRPFKLMLSSDIYIYIYIYIVFIGSLVVLIVYFIIKV